jgi:hypothetical protein
LLTDQTSNKRQERTEATRSDKNEQKQRPTIYKKILEEESTSKNNKIMWARNASRDADWAQDDADFGAAPGDGGNQFPDMSCLG